MNALKIVLADKKAAAAMRVVVHIAILPVIIAVMGVWALGLGWLLLAVAVYATRANEDDVWAFKWFVTRTLLEALLIASAMAILLLLPA